MAFYDDFKLLKKGSARVAKAFEDLNEFERSSKISGCGSELIFANKADGSHELIHGNFCHDRFCMMCQARRSSKRALELMRAVDLLDGDFIFMTLTIRNVSGGELRDTVKFMMRQFHDFINDPRIIRGVQGYAKNLEVTFNEDMFSFHPHIHVLLNVSSDYFRDHKQYLDRNEVLHIWQNYMHDDQITQLDMKKVRGKNLSKAVLEITKYVTKFSDWVFSSHCTAVLDYLSSALFHVNGSTYGGSIRKAVLKVRAESESDQSYIDRLVAIIQNANSVYVNFTRFTDRSNVGDYIADTQSSISGLFLTYYNMPKPFRLAYAFLDKLKYEELLEKKGKSYA